MSDADTYQAAPAFHESSATNNHAAWVVVTALIFLILSLVVVCGKVLYRFRATGLKLYDGLILAAAAIASAQTVCIIYACKTGMGLHRDELNEANFDIFSKAYSWVSFFIYFYSAQILLIASLAFSKLSLTSFVMALSPAVSGIVALAAQCQLPTLWISAPGRCIDQQALYIYIGVGSIITDVALVIVAILVIWHVQIMTNLRLEVIAYFSLILMVPVFTVFWLLNLPLLLSTPSDPTSHAVMPAIWSQVVLGTAILTACVLSIKPILDAFRSGAGAIATVTAPYELGSVMSGTKGNPDGRYIVSQTFPNSTTASGRRNHLGKKLEQIGILSSSASAEKTAGESQIAKENEHVDSPVKLSKAELGHSQRVVERTESITCLTDNIVLETVAYEFDYNGSPLHDGASFSHDDGGSGHSPSTRDGPFNGEVTSFS